MWSTLPKRLRPVLAVATLGSVVVLSSALRMSFLALKEVASNDQLKFGHGNGWLLPVVLDAGLIVSEVILLGASMVRVRNKRGELETYDRTVPIVLVGVFAGLTVYFNWSRVPPEVRGVAVIPPVASLLMTVALAYLMKMLAALSGEDVIYEAPPPPTPRRIVRAADTLEGELVRTDVQPDVAELQTSSGPRSNGKPARVQALAKSGYGAKRRAGQDYLAVHPDASWREVVRATGMSKRYAMQLIDERGRR